MTFDRAWRAFMDDDADSRAPDGLETRVQQAIAGRQPRRRRRSSASLTLAASLSIAAAGWFAMPKVTPIGVGTTLHSDASPLLVEYAASVVREQPDVVIPRLPARRARGGIADAPQLRVLGAAAPQETFQLVRLRLPRQALATLGFLFVDPDGTGVVDVDVLVGEDGLPRHIRTVWFEPE